MKKAVTYLAGATVTALVAMTTIPNGALAEVIGTLGYTAADGSVTLQNQGGQNLPNIVPAVRFKVYQNATINITGTGIFAGATDVTQGGNQQLTFNVQAHLTTTLMISVSRSWCRVPITPLPSRPPTCSASTLPRELMAAVSLRTTLA